MKKKLIGLFVGALAFVGCGTRGEEGVQESKKSDIKVGLVLSTGGLGDKSFNDSAFRGLERAKEELGIETKFIEPSSSAEDEQFLREFAEADYSLIIATGFQMRDAAEKVAKEYPNIKFAMIDDKIDLPNVKSIQFLETEGSFLVGALAGMVSKTGVTGFVGGLEVPQILKFQNGFEQGVKYINSDAKVITSYVGGTNPFNDPVKGKEIALSEIAQNADVIYHAAAGSGAGVFDAIKEKGVYAIGVDSNQDEIVPGSILTSMIKNVDVAVFESIEELVKGEFKTGVSQFGIKENGVGTTDFALTKEVIGEENLAKLQEIKEKIIAGEIVIK